MKISRHIPLLPALLSAMMIAGTTTLSAQLHESVSVDGTYLRDVLHPDRINQLPKLTQFRIGDSQLEYALGGVPASFSPLSPAIGATAWGADRSAEPRIGYLDLSAGSWLDASLYFGAGIIRQPDQRLDIRLQHNSTSLWKPFGDAADPRVSYAENLGLTYARAFADAGTLSVSAQYHLGYFNYYGVDPEIIGYDPADYPFKPTTQTLNDAAIKAEWTSARTPDAPLDWRASVAARHFATRTATRETDINLAGGVAKNFATGQRAGIDADLNMLLYSEAMESLSAPDNYANLSLKPFYRWQRNRVQLRIGFDLDLTFNADGKETGKHFGALHLAPDVRFDVSTRNVGFYIHLLGGNELHTLASMWQLDPYRNPHLESTMPVYTPLDAAIGAEFNPFAGFTAGVALRYKVSRNVPMEGWYMVMLNYGDHAMPGLNVPAGLTPEYGRSLERYDLSGWSAEVKLRYRPSRVFDIHANGTYTPQNGDTGLFNGLDRPRWILATGFELSPAKQVSFGVDYEYRGVRRIYTGYHDPHAGSLTPGGTRPDPTATDKMQVTSLRLPDICNLSAHIGWHVTPTFSLRVEADNILNTRFLPLPMTPTEGITLKGGLQWLF